MNNFITTTTNLEQCVGNTPLVKLQRFSPNGATILAKLEGNNPAGSVKDRPALNMIRQAENKGLMMGYKMTLLMPKNSTQERKDAMKAYGATLIEVDSMEQARDLALQMQADGKGVVLDQFNNDDNWLAHYHSTAPEIWQQTQGKITHFVSSMGTTGTIMGVAKFLKEKNPDIQIIGLQPSEGSNIAGIRRWEKAYLPKIFNETWVDTIMDIRQSEITMRQLARQEGIFCGVSSGGAGWASLQIAKDNPDAVIVFIVCDRGDRYLSTGLFGFDDK